MFLSLLFLCPSDGKQHVISALSSDGNYTGGAHFSRQPYNKELNISLYFQNHADRIRVTAVVLGVINGLNGSGVNPTSTDCRKAIGMLLKMFSVSTLVSFLGTVHASSTQDPFSVYNSSL
jgi:hypothetical protein